MSYLTINFTDVYGLAPSVRGMRNPKNSWHFSDSNFQPLDEYLTSENNINENKERLILGSKDQFLSQSLTKAGGEHCKHLRLVQVWADITASRYFWTEFDTYHFKENVSCSTMHKITSRELDYDDFDYIDHIELDRMNTLIREYHICETKEERIETFLKIKSTLPEGFRIKRTINTNYQTILNMVKQRKHHRLPHWVEFCSWALDLPYFLELTGLKIE